MARIGRPPSPFTELLRLLAEEQPYISDERTRAEIMAEQLWNSVLEGRIEFPDGRRGMDLNETQWFAAVNLILNRMYGQAPQAIDIIQETSLTLDDITPEALRQLSGASDDG